MTRSEVVFWNPGKSLSDEVAWARGGGVGGKLGKEDRGVRGVRGFEGFETGVWTGGRRGRSKAGGSGGGGFKFGAGAGRQEGGWRGEAGGNRDWVHGLWRR